MSVRANSFAEAYRIAHAAGWDAGNRRMSEHGRTAWNADDWDHAVTVFARLIATPSFAAPRSDSPSSSYIGGNGAVTEHVSQD